ncbi:hypothetical protein LCM20_18545 [Halobacillus litoralis]|uniref:hypothetical protein n=1 Tax=Halobacillus litoralis TaxID=45668 RepID=UPI001CD1BD8F|nr:hypothetical protein [Halobacillus litoralis]MCA0972602.1 hypothetical protein [Halobacillus litoralis]
MRKLFVGALLALFLVVGSFSFTPLAANEDPGDPGIGNVEPVDTSDSGDEPSFDPDGVVQPSSDPGDPGIG